MWRRPAAGGAWCGALMTRRAAAAAAPRVSKGALLASGSESTVTHLHDHRRRIPLTQLLLHPTGAICARAYAAILRPIPPKGATEFEDEEEEEKEKEKEDSDSVGFDDSDETDDGDEESEEWEAYSLDFGALERIDEEDNDEDEGSGSAGTSK